MMDNVFNDPRTESDFEPEWLPACNGKSCPALEEEDQEAVIMRSAAAVYYKINRLLNQIIIARQNAHQESTHDILKQIKKTNEYRNAFAELLEAEGLEIRPQLSGWKTVNLLLVETLVRDGGETNHEEEEYFDMMIPIPNPQQDTSSDQ